MDVVLRWSGLATDDAGPPRMYALEARKITQPPHLLVRRRASSLPRGIGRQRWLSFERQSKGLPRKDVADTDYRASCA